MNHMFSCSRVMHWSLILLSLCLIFQCDSSVELKISRYDIVQDRTLQSSIQLSLDTDIGFSASKLCTTVFFDAGETEMRRCIAMSFHTIRDHKVAILRESLAAVGVPLIANEAVSLALQYTYDEPAFCSQTVSRFCAVGYPSLDAVKLISNSQHVQELWFFLPHHHIANDVEVKRSKYRQFYSAFAREANKDVQFIYGDALANVKLLQNSSRTRLCDFMHFQSAAGVSEQQPVDADAIEALVSIVASGGTGSDSRCSNNSNYSSNNFSNALLRVAWVRDVNLEADLLAAPLITIDGSEYAPFASAERFTATHSLSSMNAKHAQQSLQAQQEAAHPVGVVRLQWQLSSTWLDSCRINAVSNYDGFTGRTYRNSDLRPAHLQEVLIGAVLSVQAQQRDGLQKPSTDTNPNTNTDSSTSCAQQQKDDVIIAITYTIRVFGETASGLRAALQRLGYDRVFLVPDMTVSAVEYLQGLCHSASSGEHISDTTENSRNSPYNCVSKCTVLQIALGPHDISLLTPDYVVFQMEQVWSPIAFAGPYKLRYALVLGAARCILSYSPRHAALLGELGYPCVYVVPLYSLYEPSLAQQQAQEVEIEVEKEGEGVRIIAATNTYDYDFIFFGGCSERRRQILMWVQDELPLCPRLNSDSDGDGDGKCYRYLLNCVGWDTGVFDNMRHHSVLRSRLVLNIHHDEHGSVLEAHRLNYLLSLGKCVVSERSDDLLLDAQYEHSVYFLDDVSTLAEVVTGLLGNATALRECERKARLLYNQLSVDVVELELALNHALIN